MVLAVVVAVVGPGMRARLVVRHVLPLSVDLPNCDVAWLSVATKLTAYLVGGTQKIQK